MKMTVLAIGIALLTSAMRAHAHETQIELNSKAAAQAKATDKRLNEVYQQVIKDFNAESKQEIIEAQRAWIKFRDAQAKFEENQYKGGSLAPLVYWNCMTRMTNARIKELEDVKIEH
jgi:uncharacterized protein YecT (DUF1311 family)